jgi:pSer/pThr/pTyr-binding forkhead associated (FHA) protein
MLKLVIREPGKQLREFQLKEEPYTLGRDKQNDIVVSDETVSRKHAQIRFENGCFIIEDLKSTAGVHVNRKRIKQACILSVGDDIFIGSTEINIEEEKSQEDKTTSLDLYEDDKTKALGPQAPAESTRKPAGEETVYIHPDEAEQEKVINYNRLLAISKKHFGKEYVLDQSETTIGRSQDCSITLDDKTVSGIHAMIRMERDDCILNDMNSKNGTLLNGSPVLEASMLRNGDEIEIGSFKFKFVHKDAAISRAQLLSEVKKKENKNFTNIALIGSLTLVCIVIVLVAISRQTKETEKRPVVTDRVEPLVSEKPAIDTPEEPAVRDVLAKSMADVYYSAANEFLKNRLWDEAIGKFEEAERIDPHYPGVQDAIIQAKKEAINCSLLEKGLLLVSQGRYTEGIEKLREIPQESVYNDETMLEIQIARDEMDQSMAREKIRVTNKTEQIPQTLSLNQKAKELIHQALKYYAEGNTKIAITKLNTALELNMTPDDPLRTRALSLKENMEKIQEVYDQGLSEYNNKQFGQAFQTWSEVLRIDQEIIGKEESHFSSRIAIYMADEFYRQAREAYENDQYIKAYSNCTKALKANSGHKGCLEIEGLLAEKAKKLYEEGYILEDLNPTQAVQKWKMVLGMSSPESEYYQKAKSRIAKYELQ